MKCPECNHQQLRGKSGMTCRSCGYRFAFDPHRHRLQGRRLTDSYIQAILYAASAGRLGGLLSYYEQEAA